MDILSSNKLSDAQFLRLCASITKGNTIYLGNFILVPIDSWWNLLKRRWNSEDRYVVLKYIDLRISKILSDIYSDIKLIDLEELSLAVNGLRQLSLTYATDAKFTSELSIIINKMEYLIKSETEKEGQVVEPKFDPTIQSKVGLVIEDGPFTSALKKIRSWSEFQNRSPPHFNSFLNGIKSSSFDSLHINRPKDDLNLS